MNLSVFEWGRTLAIRLLARPDVRFLAGNVERQIDLHSLPFYPKHSGDDSSLIWCQGVWPTYAMLEFVFELKGKSSGIVDIDIEYSDGSCDKNISLFYACSRLTKRILYFPTSPRRLHFTFSGAEDNLVIHRLQMIPLVSGFARKRMLQRIVKSQGGAINLSNDKLNLYNFYQKTYVAQQQTTAYQNWIEEVEKHLMNKLCASADLFGQERLPFFSIIIFANGSELLKYAIQSVLQQSFSGWELFIITSYPTGSDLCVDKLLEQYIPNRDNVYLKNMQDASLMAVIDSVLVTANGKFMIFLGERDELAKHALLALYQFNNKNPEAKIIYSDEDCITSDGLRSEPNFKPDWSVDTFFSKNYLVNLISFRIDLVKNFKDFYSGDVNIMGLYDLSRLCVLCLGDPDKEVLHIPCVLYHRRESLLVLDNDKNVDNKINLSLKSVPERLQSHVFPVGPGGVLKSKSFYNACYMYYSLPESLPLVSLLIPTRDMFEALHRCIESIFNLTNYPNYEIIILDNQSQESEVLAYLDCIQKDKRVSVIQYDQSFNFSAINNFGVRQSNGDIVVLLNNDTEVIAPGWLTEMIFFCWQPSIGCVGAKLYYPDGKIQHAGIILSEQNIAMHGHRYFDRDADGYQGRLKLVQNYSAVTGACLAVRKEIYEQVGGLNEKHLAIAYNDVDFCLKVREAGYRNLWTPYAELYHHESMSRGHDDTPVKRARLKKEAAYMRKRWGKELANDPCYNPNLTPLKEDFSVHPFPRL